jgi:hypothetical protein
MTCAQKDIIFKIQFVHLVIPLAVYELHLDVQKDIKPHPGSPRVPRDIPRASTADVQKDTKAQLMARVVKVTSFQNKVGYIGLDYAIYPLGHTASSSSSEAKDCQEVFQN